MTKDKLLCMLLGHRIKADWQKTDEGIAEPLLPGMFAMPYETFVCKRVYCERCKMDNPPLCI